MRAAAGMDAFLAHYRPSVGTEWPEHLTKFGFYAYWGGSSSFIERLGLRTSHRARLLATLQRKAEDRLQLLWRRMLEDAHRAALKVPNLALSQALVRLRRAVRQIECDSRGELLHRDEALAGLDALRDTFLCFYSFPESLETLLAGHSWSQGLPAQRVERWRALPEEMNRAAGELRLVDSQIGLFDRLNPFRQTPEKRKARFLSQLQNNLEKERESLREELLRELSRTQPVLALYFRIPVLARAIRAVRVERVEYEDGPQHRLKGTRELEKALKKWMAEFADALGPPVGLCELLLQAEGYFFARGST